MCIVSLDINSSSVEHVPRTEFEHVVPLLFFQLLYTGNVNMPTPHCMTYLWSNMNNYKKSISVDK